MDSSVCATQLVVGHGSASATAKTSTTSKRTPPCFTCERCNRAFAKRSNLTRHLQRQKGCELRNPIRLGLADFVLLLTNVSLREDASHEYILLLWNVCLSVHMLDRVIGYERIYDLITQMSSAQLALILQQSHSGIIRKVLLQVYTHLKELKSKAIAHLNGRSIDGMLDVFDQQM